MDFIGIINKYRKDCEAEGAPPGSQAKRQWEAEGKKGQSKAKARKRQRQGKETNGIK